MAEEANLEFAEAEFTYDELADQLAAYAPDPDAYPHDVPSMISIAEGIRAGRMGNVAVGGCLLKDDEVIDRDISKAIAPYHRTDLHVEMVLLNTLEDHLCDDPTPRMRDYTLFTSQERVPCAWRGSASIRWARPTTSTATARAPRQAKRRIGTASLRASVASGRG